MVSSVTASCNIKQVSFFLLSICFLFWVKINRQIQLICFKIDVLLCFYIQIANVKQHLSDFSPLKPGKAMLISPEKIALFIT